ncbi:Mrp/NBP35 family ATP-binding protein [Rhizobium sp. C1]|uniref:Mrp/NBP35 family ATP-binding protein n=1 Tax=Rhizobium sp. C1 TaxID=1349799 RepID=UPI001E511419|nr:Mrp/NBP35 family ATP-binding protein [Rhizobium sp. C1]MCD2179741.1 Mrp/NBP35 family ATP-binding protein [Rhizobium sp. C1]
MSAELSARVIDKLKTLQMPGAGKDVVSLGLVSDVFVSQGKAYFSISVPSEAASSLEPLREEAARLASSVPGIEAATVVLTADRKAGSPAAAAQSQRPAHAHAQPRPVAKQAIPGIGAIVAVASGKGGVGKSTTAVNLALAFQANGLRAAVLDADIYGPSLPRLMKIAGRPQQIDGKLIRPMENYGMKVMSMGFLVDEGTAMIWRGPMIQSALLQMLREVAWGDLDVLVIDMPPGTGDVQLTLAQQAALAGAVIVSTPQDLALIDARKAVNMFNKVEVPILGIVENMSYFVCPNCGTSHDIFGHGGAKAEAQKIGAPFLGEIPLDMEIRLNSDAGTPVVVSHSDGPHAKAYREIARRVWEGIEGRAAPVFPEITFE